MADVSYADVIRTVNGLLKTKYPEITRYGNDTVDKAVPPYFFVECVPVGAEHVTKNMLHKGCSVLITYMQNFADLLCSGLVGRYTETGGRGADGTFTHGNDSERRLRWQN